MGKKFNYEEAVDAGRRIKAAYSQKGWVLPRLAAEMGYSLGMVQKVVSGGYSISRRFAKRLDAVLPGWRDAPLVDEVEKYKIVDGETVRAGIDDLIKRFEFRIVRLAGGDATNAVVAQVTETLLNLYRLREQYKATAKVVGVDREEVVRAVERAAFIDERDGRVYQAVKIGGTVWMAQNLDYAAKGSMRHGDGGDNGAKYGRLYDWETAKEVCPAGWRLPSDADWTALETCAGGRDTAGKRLKAKTGWGAGGNGTDDFGFSALPGGQAYHAHRYSSPSECRSENAGNAGYWWSATEHDDRSACYRSMYGDSGCVYKNDKSKGFMLSARCVRDDAGV